jgi:hypothetical protein
MKGSSNRFAQCVVQTQIKPTIISKTFTILKPAKYFFNGIFGYFKAWCQECSQVFISFKSC